MTPPLGGARPRFLMCPPEHFDVTYSINPWMRPEDPPDPERALTQWTGLRATLEDAGASVELLQPVEGLPDLVFTSDHGLVQGRRFIRARPRHEERRPEIDHTAAWFDGEGFEVVALDDGDDVFLETGEVVPFRDRLLASHGYRSTEEGLAALARVVDTPVVPLRLTDPLLYHLDATFCPLDDRRAMVAPHALDEPSLRAVSDLVEDLLILDRQEAMTFCANGVLVGRALVVSTCPPRVGRALEAWGFDVVESPATEFLKAGGGPHCLTLRIEG